MACGLYLRTGFPMPFPFHFMAHSSPLFARLVELSVICYGADAFQENRRSYIFLMTTREQSGIARGEKKRGTGWRTESRNSYAGLLTLRNKDQLWSCIAVQWVLDQRESYNMRGVRVLCDDGEDEN